MNRFERMAVSVDLNVLAGGKAKTESVNGSELSDLRRSDEAGSEEDGDNIASAALHCFLMINGHLRF